MQSSSRSSLDEAVPPDSIDLSGFPSTRYQGSKRKIVPWLYEAFRQLGFSTALDVFGGTASVSYLLKKMGKGVTFNDALQFNHLNGKAFIENDSVTLSEQDVAFALAPGCQSRRHIVRDVFSGMYFTGRENGWIDNTIARIASLSAPPDALEYKRALLMWVLFQCCLIKRPFNLFHRPNLYIRLADVKRAFGNKTSWDISFGQRFRQFCFEANAAVFQGQQKCESINRDVGSLPVNGFDLIYIDPPYLAKGSHNETSDYRRCYHFLEGLCSYSEWEHMIDYDSPNLRLKPLRVNDWIDLKKQPVALDALFETFSKSIIVMSYKKFGVPSIETLIRKLKRHGKKVTTCSRHYKYALNHQNGTAELNREVLLIAD